MRAQASYNLRLGICCEEIKHRLELSIFPQDSIPLHSAGCESTEDLKVTLTLPHSAFNLENGLLHSPGKSRCVLLRLFEVSPAFPFGFTMSVCITDRDLPPAELQSWTRGVMVKLIKAIEV